MFEQENKDIYYLHQTLKIAQKGMYSTTPNPRVGCVIVKDNKVISHGWHRYAGGEHAEIAALNKIGEEAKGASVYLSLEPCCHKGKTQPCSNALIQAGVNRVVVAMNDPNPLVAGKGCASLKQAGIQVDTNLLVDPVHELNKGFIKRMQHNLPYVRCKLAVSIDGRTAAADKNSNWLSCDLARNDVQKWRAQSCAIITGIGSVVADNPRLTLRNEQLKQDKSWSPAISPKRIVIDSKLRIPLSSKILTGDKIIVATIEPEALDKKLFYRTQEKLENLGHQILVLPSRQKQVDLYALLKNLAQREYNEVLIEAGSKLAGSFMESNLVDELITYITPKILGHNALPMFRLPFASLEEQIKLVSMQYKQIGTDMRIVGQVVKGTVANSALRG